MNQRPLISRNKREGRYAGKYRVLIISDEFENNVRFKHYAKYYRSHVRFSSLKGE